MRSCSFLLFFAVFALPCSGQLSRSLRPRSEVIRQNLALKTDESFLPSPPMVLIAPHTRAEKTTKTTGVYYFAHKHQVSLNLKDHGVWYKLPDGSRIWQLAIRCPGALSIHLTYSEFWLPPAATFHLYTPDKNEILGAFTSLNNKGSNKSPRGFATALLPGDTIILEYYEPKAQRNKGILSIDKVFEGYQ